MGDSNLDCDSTKGTMRGETFDGQAFEGSDSLEMFQ